MNRRRITLVSAAITLLAAVAFVQTANADTTPVMPAYLSAGLAECKAQLAVATTTADRTWANECVRLAQRAVDAWVKANPTPSPTATATPTQTATPTNTPSVTPIPSPTSTPTPTVPPTTIPPTSPPAQTTNCLARPSACGFPDATNTGVPTAWVPIHTTTGDVSVTTSGATLDGWDIHGCLTVTAANVTVRNSRINANCFYAVNSLSTGLVLDHVQISCAGGTGTGVTAAGYSIIASDISRCENGLNVGGPVSMVDSYVHDLTFISNATTHTDGAQFNQGAGPVTFRHNTIDAGPDSNSAIIMWDEGDPQNHDVTIANNILAKGGFTLYCPRNNASNVQVTGNHFVPGFYGPSNGCTAGHVTVWSGNVLDATGAALGGA